MNQSSMHTKWRDAMLFEKGGIFGLPPGTQVEGFVLKGFQVKIFGGFGFRVRVSGCSGLGGCCLHAL